MPKLTIDGKEIEVEKDTTIIQACEALDIEIPRFCYHEKLAIAGNCRMCLVEVEKSPKLVASCAQPALDGMVVKTNSKLVHDARKGVMEFLLINHPLDCPICDQGGECDLQDQSMFYGKATSKFKEGKRSVTDKDFGPLIKTHMTRCIHCTRCVRFLEDIAGTTELGAIGRGENMEIATYIKNSITSELSGNIIDLCPVGALTSKPYAYRARSWELSKTYSIDVLDAVGSNIRIDSRGNEVMRILPLRNDFINEEWISDKTRFAYDGLKYQRLDCPMYKVKDEYVQGSWEDVFEIIKMRLKKTQPDKIGAIAGDLADVESMMILKDILSALGSNLHECRQDGSGIRDDVRESYIFNTTICNIQDADSCLIIGSNPRYEATILNARIRSAYAHSDKKLKIATIGDNLDLTYKVSHLGNKPEIIKDIASNKHEYCKVLDQSKNPMIILGASIFCREDYKGILYYVREIIERYNFITENWNGFNVLQSAASRVGGLDIGFIPQNEMLRARDIIKSSQILFLLGADEINLQSIPKETFVIYQGHHGGPAAARADIILPAAAYTEKNATFINLEGVVQETRPAIPPPGEAMEDYKILMNFAKYMNIQLQYNSFKGVREKMQRIIDAKKRCKDKIFASIKEEDAMLSSARITSAEIDYFAHDIISRNSRTMTLCKVTQYLDNSLK